MGSDLTAAGILAHVLETSGVQVGTTIDRKDLENMAASLDDQLSALIAAAKRATAAEARVGELTEALEKVSGVLEDERWDGSREDGPRAMLDWCMTIARTALKPQEPHP